MNFHRSNEKAACDPSLSYVQIAVSKALFEESPIAILKASSPLRDKQACLPAHDPSCVAELAHWQVDLDLLERHLPSTTGRIQLSPIDFLSPLFL